MKKNPETFLLFTTDGYFNEFVPEAEAETADGIWAEYIKHTKKNKYAQYMILCPDGKVRSGSEVVEKYIHPPKKLHEEIPGDTVIWKFNGIGAAAVYLGWLTNLTPAAVKWRQDDESLETAEICDGEPDFITLNEIAEQFPDQMITVIIDDPLNGEIWNFGNAGKKWLRIGITGGYA